MSKRFTQYPPSISRSSQIWAVVRSLLGNVLIFLAMLAGVYLLFTLFDTPEQHRLRGQNEALEAEFAKLEMRYDTVEQVLDNVIERDKNVFRILFESEPYAFNDSASEQR